MLLVVTDQVAQSEAVVAGDKIDGVVGMPRGIAVDVEAAADAFGHGGEDGAGFAAHETGARRRGRRR